MMNLTSTCQHLTKYPESVGCNVIENISIGVELELQGIALQRCRIAIGILLVFFSKERIVILILLLK